MPRKSSQSIADKWASRLGSAGQDMQAGVMAVQRNPADAAIARKQAWVDGVNRAAAADKFAKGLAKVTVQAWQQAYIQKGIPRITAGASQAKPKVVALMDKMGPFQDNLRAQIDQQNPRGDKAANINRAVAWMQGMANFKNT